MNLLNIDINQISLQDLERLVTDEIAESKTVEYKENLNLSTGDCRKEFLADLSAFSNTQGGDILFGVRESAGIAAEILGIEINDTDQRKQQVENLIRDGISPRIPYEINFINIEDNNYVIFIRLKPSLNNPHRVIFSSHDKFYKRNSSGKYPMDLDELRDSFLSSSSTVEKIRNYRTNRIYEVASGNTPVPLIDTEHLFMIHIIPDPNINSSHNLDSDTMKRFKEGDLMGRLRPINAGGWSPRINMDGVVAYSGAETDRRRTYIQLSRNGNIEAVESTVLARDDENPTVPATYLQNTSNEFVSNYIGLLQELGFTGPFYVMFTLLGIKNYTVAIPNRYVFTDVEPITQDRILLPEIILENENDNISEKISNVFSIVWNASGISQILE